MTVGKDTSIDIQDQYDEVEDFVTTSSFVSALTVNCIGVRESTFVIHNKGVDDLMYQVLANLRQGALITDPTGTDDDDKGWVLVRASTTIKTGDPPQVETLSNTWTTVIVQIKHKTTSTTANVYHRGEN